MLELRYLFVGMRTKWMFGHWTKFKHVTKHVKLLTITDKDSPCFKTY